MLKKLFRKFGKKGQNDFGGLYELVLTLGLVGIITSVVIVVISNMENTTAVTGDASTALNNTITAISPITNTWLSLLVTVAVLAIVLFLVIRGFGRFGNVR